MDFLPCPGELGAIETAQGTATDNCNFHKITPIQRKMSLPSITRNKKDTLKITGRFRR